MLVVFSHRHDSRARALVEGWKEWDAALLTSDDLSRPGWCHDLRRPGSGRAVVSGRQVSVADISGALVLWPAVFEQELAHILPAERPYVAAEMTAFLRSWLTQLPCRVLNRPTATSLAGPSWRPEQWVHAAARLGIPVRPVRRRVRLTNGGALVDPVAEGVAVTVIGRRCFGDAHPTLLAHARRLAAAAGVGWLVVHFQGPDRGAPILTADPVPDLAPGEVVDAARAYLLSTNGEATARTPR